MPDPGCKIEGCDRPHYAKGLCVNHWRQSKRYRYSGDRQPIDQKYDKSPKGIERSQRAYQKRRLILAIAGVPTIQQAFSDPEALAKLRSQAKKLKPIWGWMTAEQKSAIKN